MARNSRAEPSCPGRKSEASSFGFIEPGKPNQNAFVESVNGRFRLECLNVHWFSTLEGARHVIEDWRLGYDDVRPHRSLDDKTPTDFAAAHRGTAV